MTEFRSISKSYGNVAVLDNFSLVLEKDKPTVIMGRSGCGKTTLLRIAAGLEKPDKGLFVHTDGEVAFMFQEPRLLPWKNTLDNVRAVLAQDNASQASKYLELVGMSPRSDGLKMPYELSGGMKQRVAFARFLAFAEQIDASLLLLDEPFSALDADTSMQMLSILKKFSEGKVLAAVSHDDSDAEALGADTVRL